MQIKNFFFCVYRVPRYLWGVYDWNTGVHFVETDHSKDIRIHLFGLGISIGKEF